MFNKIITLIIPGKSWWAELARERLAQLEGCRRGRKPRPATEGKNMEKQINPSVEMNKKKTAPAG